LITAFISRKGGVGKTTTAVNLAAALAERGRSTLLVDLDSQCSATLSLGVERHAFPPSAADMLLNEVSAPEVIRSTEIDGLDLITGSVDLLSADVELGRSGWHRRRMRAALEPVAAGYDHILLDCPPSLAVLPQAALVASDSYIVPLVPQYLAVEGIQNLIDSVERLGDRFGHSPALLGIVLTVVDYRTRETRQQVERVRRAFGNLVFAVEVRVNVRLAEAPGAGRPIFQYAPESTGARAYGLLAEEMLLRCQDLAGRSARGHQSAGGHRNTRGHRDARGHRSAGEDPAREDLDDATEEEPAGSPTRTS
jgi:chromosome partitioning protein